MKQLRFELNSGRTAEVCLKEIPCFEDIRRRTEGNQNIEHEYCEEFFGIRH